MMSVRVRVRVRKFAVCFVFSTSDLMGNTQCA